MTAAGVYASRFGRVQLADPTRQRVVFTAARARGEGPGLSEGAALAVKVMRAYGVYAPDWRLAA